MKEASAVTPNTQFFLFLASASGIASLRFVSAASCGGSRTGRMGRGGGIRPEIISLRPNPFAGAGRLGVESRWFSYREPRENMMKRTLIRYKTKPDMADKNAELIA